MQWWRKSAVVDAAALVAMAVVMVVVYRPFIRHGMCFNDSAWYFHFGNRTLHGDVPYRDYVFQVGPLPIYVDALFQDVFGEKYLASMYAALAIRILRVFVVWSIARRLADRWCAGLFAFACAFDLELGWAHHWSWAYAELFISLAGLAMLMAVRVQGRRELAWLAIAGACAGLVVSARQATAVMLALVLVAATTIMCVRGEYFTRKKLAVLWLGFAVGLAIVAAALAAVGALGPAIQQMFLDAPAKKSVHGVTAVFDAVFGGAVTQPGVSWWWGAAGMIGVPLAIVIAALHLASRASELTVERIAPLAVPIVLVVALLLRFVDVFSDIPRVFLTAVTILAVLWPARLRAWLGVEPILAIGLGALALASEWALQLSLPGRGWSDVPAMLIGVLALALASARVTVRAKRWLCGSLAFAAVAHVAIFAMADRHPFALDAASDGSLSDTRFMIANPVFRGIRVSESRKRAVEWLRSEVPRGSTCFIYGEVPALYDVLACANPTRIDVTIPDFISVADADEALAALRASPPEYLLSAQLSFLSPPLDVDLPADVAGYSLVNSEAAQRVYRGLRALIAEQYESVGLVGDALGPQLAKQAESHWDMLNAVRVYRRRHL